MRKFQFTGEKAVNAALLLASAFYLYYTVAHYKIGTVRLPKEGFMPLILGCGAVAISSFLTAQSFLNRGDARDVTFNIHWLKFFAITAVSLAYAFSMKAVGYMPGTFVFLLAIFRLAGVSGWRKPVLISLISAAALYVVFKMLLGVSLPAGFIGI